MSPEASAPSASFRVGDLVVWKKDFGVFLKVTQVGNGNLIGEDANGTPMAVPTSECRTHPLGLDDCEMCQ